MDEAAAPSRETDLNSVDYAMADVKIIVYRGKTPWSRLDGKGLIVEHVILA